MIVSMLQPLGDCMRPESPLPAYLHGRDLLALRPETDGSWHYPEEVSHLGSGEQARRVNAHVR